MNRPNREEATDEAISRCNGKYIKNEIATPPPLA